MGLYTVKHLLLYLEQLLTTNNYYSISDDNEINYDISKNINIDHYNLEIKNYINKILTKFDLKPIFGIDIQYIKDLIQDINLLLSYYNFYIDINNKNYAVIDNNDFIVDESLDVDGLKKKYINNIRLLSIKMMIKYFNDFEINIIRTFITKELGVILPKTIN